MTCKSHVKVKFFARGAADRPEIRNSVHRLMGRVLYDNRNIKIHMAMVKRDIPLVPFSLWFKSHNAVLNVETFRAIQALERCSPYSLQIVQFVRDVHRSEHVRSPVSISLGRCKYVDPTCDSWSAIFGFGPIRRDHHPIYIYICNVT